MTPEDPGDDVRIGGTSPVAWPVVARIWRTVDVERTVADLGLSSEPVDPDELFGGQGVLVRPPDGPPIVVLEPSTEGRLAATLARHGEGDAGVYVAPPGGLSEARKAGLTLGRTGRGPFGPEALQLMTDENALGTAQRFVVIVEPPPATIEP